MVSLSHTREEKAAEDVRVVSFKGREVYTVAVIVNARHADPSAFGLPHPSMIGHAHRLLTPFIARQKIVSDRPTAREERRTACTVTLAGRRNTQKERVVAATPNARTGRK
ncbi:hypothetical protein SCP_0906220 [Sparassis crispa]|uniref:Uncharacterized protein n=1 Tax=Sparassis crispa TaxID=139825 RepID=A0A401GWZ7_9APHY|nr:hypothetical protein SCP_0906220 [Sparassis crispa]GBE86741.1 hypothetical protein SCP_0906220 [Sparassis crispa]